MSVYGLHPLAGVLIQSALAYVCLIWSRHETHRGIRKFAAVSAFCLAALAVINSALWFAEVLAK